MIITANITLHYKKNMLIITKYDYNSKQAGDELCLNSTKLCCSEREDVFKLKHSSLLDFVYDKLRSS